MIIPMLCVTIFVILVVWFLLPRVARLMIHTPTAISIFVCLSMVQLMAVFISMRCTLCGHFLQVALTLILDTLAFLLLLSLLLPSLLIMFIPSTFKRPVSSWKALNLRKTLLMASSVRLKPLNCSRLPCVYAQETLTFLLTQKKTCVKNYVQKE